MQPRVMALLGRHAEEIFIIMHKARREIEVASEMLAWKVQNPIGPVPDHNEEFWKQCRRDIWDHGGFEPEKDKVGKKLSEFCGGRMKTIETFDGPYSHPFHARRADSS
jgi:hypothetical protein